jgi:hypothetical protein
MIAPPLHRDPIFGMLGTGAFGSIHSAGLIPNIGTLALWNS